MTTSRTLSASIAAIIVGAGIVVTAGAFYLQRSIQPRQGEVALPGLVAPVDISFDAWAIPSIVGRGEADVLRAQGFVHASERLWQMELFQRITQGRLAEIFGPAAVETDRLIRTLDLVGASLAALAGVSPEDRRLLEAYAEGVNERVRSWRGPLPPEFLLLGIRPQEWSPAASLGIASVMALDLSGWRGELDRMATLARIPSALHAELEPFHPSWGPTIMQDSAPRPITLAPPTSVAARRVGRAGVHRTLVSAPESARGGVLDRGDSWDPIATLASFALHASNSWAIGPSRTVDGHALLANDMHLSLRAPSTWFINGLHASDSDMHVAGLSIPGAPGVVVGLNRAVAWGFTNAMLDDGDFVVESVNLDASMYRDAGDWQPFLLRTETIEVRGADPVEHVVRQTARGPVITDVLPSAGLTLSLLWTGIEGRSAATALFDMGRAGSVADFREALTGFQSPHQNVIYVSTEGEIGYRLAGSIPLRAGADPIAPISFETLPTGWTGFVPAADMPALAGPPSDYLASANNLQSHDLFGVVGTRYPLPGRARRIVDRVSAARGWTVDDMVALQLDVHSVWAERLRPRLLAAARRLGREDVRGALEAWDLRVSLDSREALVFYIWLYRLRHLIAADELDGYGYFPDRALDAVIERGTSVWVDDTSTPDVETLHELEVAALETAIEIAAGRTWGEVHTESSIHPLGQVGVLDRLLRFDSGPYPAPGGRHTTRPADPSIWGAIDSTAWTPPFAGAYGPSERFVARMDPSDPAGHFFLPTGQAGNPLDPHYRSMVGRWLDGEMVRVSLDPEVAVAAEQSRLRLTPAPSRREP